MEDLPESCLQENRIVRACSWGIQGERGDPESHSSKKDISSSRKTAEAKFDFSSEANFLTLLPLSSKFQIKDDRAGLESLLG